MVFHLCDQGEHEKAKHISETVLRFVLVLHSRLVYSYTGHLSLVTPRCTYGVPRFWVRGHTESTHFPSAHQNLTKYLYHQNLEKFDCHQLHEHLDKLRTCT